MNNSEKVGEEDATATNEKEWLVCTLASKTFVMTQGESQHGSSSLEGQHES